MVRPFDTARSNYVVMDYHVELVQLIIALDLADLSISDCSCTFEDFYILFKSATLGLCKGPLQIDLMLAYHLKGMALCPSFC